MTGISSPAKNISENVNIVLHPRTGVPLENPHIKIRIQAESTLRKYELKVGDLWD